MTTISFGPCSIGSVNEAKRNLHYFKERGLDACEVAFTYGVYMTKEDAIEIGEEAKKINVSLSIHAPYYINLNSEDEAKLNRSIDRIIECCRIGHFLGARKIVFHPGFYGKRKEDAYRKIKESILLIKDIIKKEKLNVEICPEIMGKVNVFGSIEEISSLVKDTGCSFCIDFAHILARYKDRMFESIKKSFPQKEWHCHFSGIEYGEKGERNHRKTKKEEWIELFNFLKKIDKKITIINESPDDINDSIEGSIIWKKIINKS
ncbi:MAG: TIM barrel protein [Candidatus Pacearchaeota archaeon]